MVKGTNLPSREMSLSATRPTADASRIGAVESAVEGKPAATKAAGGNGQLATPDNAFATRATAHSDRFAPHRDLVYSRTLTAADTLAAAFGLLLSMMIVGQDHPAADARGGPVDRRARQGHRRVRPSGMARKEINA